MDKKQMILDLIDYYSNGSKTLFSKKLGVTPQTISSWISRNTFDKELIFAKCENINAEWLLTGEGYLLKSEEEALKDNKKAEREDILPIKKKLIPFYDDVSTIGGLNDRIATADANNPTEWIDAGDWFPEATAAIRHYGDSMVEYPSGSILALKRVNDLRLIMNGRNYVIETTEYRVTKQLQDEGDHFMTYSTNRETYPNGHQIHAPFPIPKDAILHIDLVLGCVTKEYSNGAIPIRK